MERRQFIAAITATPVLAAIPLPALALARRSAIEVAAPLDHPHLALCVAACQTWLADGHIYFRDDMFGRRMTLSDPRFFIKAEGKVWNWMTGDTDEPGLTILITDSGIPITATRIASSIGHAEYFSSSQPGDYPDYFVKQPWLSYEKFTAIEDKFPKGTFDPDLRWLEQMKIEKAAAAA